MLRIDEIAEKVPDLSSHTMDEHWDLQDGQKWSGNYAGGKFEISRPTGVMLGSNERYDVLYLAVAGRKKGREKLMNMFSKVLGTPMESYSEDIKIPYVLKWDRPVALSLTSQNH